MAQHVTDGLGQAGCFGQTQARALGGPEYGFVSELCADSAPGQNAAKNLTGRGAG